MPIDHRAVLASIKRFDQLIAYLRDEMGWPIDSDDFEELTFEYTPEELGIDTVSTAKIQEIKRMRPLSPNQPWGIFFVKFEPRKLPVVALRRILSCVALKKRASANSAERAAWAADDLLFVSNYGEGDARQISFAHFSQDGGKDDLPTLKVLGWDNLDTPLHLDHVAELLTERLAWPDDDKDLARWRESWRSAFTLRHREVITTSRTLAVRLAELARAIRDRITTVLAIETKNGPVTKLMKAFQEALVHDLDADGFADMYAQTIAYGLLSARVTNPKANTADGFATQLPVTNPFLKEMMETFLHVGGRKSKAGRGPGIDFDELGVSEVVELLDDANMEAVVRDFGDKNPQEDPVIHFYELFLKEYDAKKRMQRGVFYTPRPVVSYIVRSVHELLQTEFGLADGLADTATWGAMAERHAGLTIPDDVKPTDRFVTILDPATGTGTFLVEAIAVIHRTLVEKWQREGHSEKKILDLWNDYVPKHLLPRLHGYELLMAPYAIAHLKIGLKLHETGYRFESAERARIYLTNSLEPAQDFTGQFETMIPALAHEAEAVNTVKRHQRFTVVIGNPPYSGVSSNMTEHAQQLVDAYKIVDGQALNERKLWLQDDYVKFMRAGQTLIQSAHVGILGYVTNHAYLDNPTFRGMRQSLMDTFQRIAVIDLHGNSKKKESSPSGESDRNVFDIQQGVAVSLGVHWATRDVVAHADVWGTREEKYDWLSRRSVETSELTKLAPDSPYYFFVERDEEQRSEYGEYPSINDVFPVSVSGIVTSRDAFVMDTDSALLEGRIRTYVDAKNTDDDIQQRFSLTENYAWRIKDSRHELQREGFRAHKILPILYRPFDRRLIYYHPAVVWRTRGRVMGAMLGAANVCLISVRQVAEGIFNHVYVSDGLVESRVTLSNKGIAFCWPLYTNDLEQGSLFAGRKPSCNPAIVEAWANQLGIRYLPDEGDGNQGKLSPRDIFGYCYAVLYSPGYRDRYSEFIRIDFPRLPLTSSLELFRDLARLGGELVALHLVEARAQQALSARYDTTAKAWRYEVGKGQRLPVTLSFSGPRNPVVSKVGWSEDTVWIDAVKPKKGAADTMVTGSIGFHGVPEEVWNFHIGGYQVCEKWLKDRKDRTLTAEDITHYHRIVIALHETIRLMREIDEAIDAHGGWPGAFAPQHV